MESRYTGVEIADSVISSNRSRFPAATWSVSTADALPVASGSQDCVFAYYVLDHCVFPQRFLDNMLDKVKAGGRLLLVFSDIVVSKMFGSQAVGRDRDKTQQKSTYAVVEFFDRGCVFGTRGYSCQKRCVLHGRELDLFQST